MIYFDKNGKLVVTEEQIEGVNSERAVFMDCPGVTIHGYTGSTAEAYAREHGLAFEPITDEGSAGKFDSIIDKYGN